MAWPRHWQAQQIAGAATLTALTRHDSTLWAVGHDATILKSSDGAKTWRRVHYAPAQQAPLLDVLFIDATHGFAVGAYGSFLETRDGGEYWAERSISENDFHLNAITCLGDGTLLMVDANQKWDLMQASHAAHLLEGLDLAWLEEPLHPDDIRSHRVLAGRTAIPIALGEHVYTTHAFRDYMENQAVAVIQVDVCRIGGITPWLEVAALANSFNIRVCPHAGDLMQVHQHLVKVIPNNWLLEVIPIWEKGPFRHQIRLKDGKCLSPAEPGASSEFTREALDEFRVH